MKRSKPDPHSPYPIALITGEVIHMYELLILPNHPSTTQTHKFPWLRLIHNYKASVHQRTTEDAAAQSKCRGGGAALKVQELAGNCPAQQPGGVGSPHPKVLSALALGQ